METCVKNNSNARGAVNAKMNILSSGRTVRKREPGDGKGVDIGIAPGAFGANLQSHLDKLPKETHERMLKHISAHVDQALGPIVKLLEREGNENDVRLAKDVGPNMLRTIIEYLEDKRS